MTDNTGADSGRSAWRERLLFSTSKGEDTGRTLKLVLDVPLPRSTGRSRDYREVLKAASHAWQGLANHPIELLRKIEHFLNKVNTEKMPARQRTVLVEHALQYACPAIRRIYAAQYKAESLPESHERREGLTVAAKVCAQLASGYKQQVVLDFALTGKAYARVRGRVRAHSLRVLELIRIEQRLRAMRYQKLSRQTWVDCNRLFFAVAQCEDVSAPGPGLNCLQPEIHQGAGALGRRSPPLVSIQQTFLAIHLFGLIDCYSLSARKMHIADTQLSRVLNQLVIETDEGDELVPGQAIIYYAQDGPAFFQRRDDKATAAPRFDTAPKGFWRRAPAEPQQQEMLTGEILAKTVQLASLTQTLSAEYRKLISHFAEAPSAVAHEVSDQTDLARLLVLETLCERLQPRQRVQRREYVSGQQVLHVYNGFMPTYNLLNDARQGVAGSGQGLRDILARQSALIAPDAELQQAGQWFVLDKNTEAVHMRTRESQFTHAMFIGQLVAFAYTRAQLASPLLGYVARLSRTSGNELEVTMRILSSKAQATMAQNAFLSQNDLAMPAILLQDDGTQRLLLHHSHSLAVSTPLQLDVAGELRKFTLTGLAQLQREFIVYNLADGRLTH